MLYLDANVFVHAAVDQGRRGAKASDVLREVAQGETAAMTSVLTVDEVVYALRGLRGRETAISRGKQLLSYPNLRLAAVTPENARAALELMENNARLGPRDAFHAAVALASGAKILSDDTDFDGVRGLRREPLE